MEGMQGVERATVPIEPDATAEADEVETKSPSESESGSLSVSGSSDSDSLANTETTLVCCGRHLRPQRLCAPGGGPPPGNDPIWTPPTETHGESIKIHISVGIEVAKAK